ncbi:hypothetical protein SNE40_004953 [Patella caerulea]|uniref:TIR domain-containing protein n=1 Tax=Patella caerulea TaxID=87958 RepID=A0AAN8K440_PATCE
MAAVPVLQLPLGKKYHVFVYHKESPEDTQIAKMLLTKLTSNGFICCCNQDFSPGRTSIGSTVHAIDMSMKMVIIYSETFFKSTESSFTIEMQVQHCLNTEKFLLIPIQFDDCQIPLFYNTLPVIDVRQPEEVWYPQLVKSIKNISDISKQFVAGPRISTILIHVCGYEPARRNNMEVLACRRGVYSSRESKKLKMRHKMLHQMQKAGVILSERKFEAMMSDVDFMFRDYCRLNKLLFPVLTYFFICAIIGTVVLRSTRYFDADPIRRWLPMIILFGFGFCVCVVASWVIRTKFQDYYHRCFKDYLVTINDKLFDERILITVVEENIYIVYYDYDPCLNYLIENKTLFGINNTSVKTLKEIYKKWRDWLYGKIPDTEQNVERRQLVKEGGMYACWYLQNKLPKPAIDRHVRDGQCLCQYIEKNIQGDNVTLESVATRF